MLTLEQATIEFFNHCLYEKNLSSKTIKFYKIDLKQFSVSASKTTYPYCKSPPHYPFFLSIRFLILLNDGLVIPRYDEI